MAALPAQAEDWRSSYTLYGTPGLIDMPTALSAPDAEIATTVAGFGGQLRTSVTFQITPRLSGTFRYTGIDDFITDGEQYFDRSFDLRYRFIDEGRVRPAVALGLRDFIGTGIYSAEYLAATKTLSNRLRVTGGIGWGRLGSYNGFDNPLGAIDDRFDSRPPIDFGVGGELETGQFFRGDAALFGGVEYRLTDDLTLTAEYSSDAYVEEVARTGIERDTPVNIGLSWQPRPNYELSLAYIGGTEIALAGSVILNPKERPTFGGLDSAPVPVGVRSAEARQAVTWDRTTLPDAALATALTEALATEGIEVTGVEISDRQVRLRYENMNYRSEAQVLGRVARLLTQAMPPSVELFVLEPTRDGLPLSATTLRRSDVEALENTPGGSDEMLRRASFGPAGPREGLTPVVAPGNRFSWGLAPYVELSVFDGDNPVRGEAGAELSARYELQRNLILSGAVRQSIYSDFDDPGSISPSTLPEVRRDSVFYSIEGDPGIEHLTLTWYNRFGPDLYGRATLGYLERMYGGLSTEVLWKPVDSRLALGAELNVVRKRAYDMLFGFQDVFDPEGPDITDPILTGHISAYYNFGEGWHGQVDVGRYLAGDYGATFTLDREFANGWRVGGYFTLTDVPFEDFGEGSFDKGLQVTIPFDWAVGQPSRNEVSTRLASLTRDGGAQVNVDGRLYNVIRDGHLSDLENEWGRFWR